MRGAKGFAQRAHVGRALLLRDAVAQPADRLGVVSLVCRVHVYHERHQIAGVLRRGRKTKLGRKHAHHGVRFPRDPDLFSEDAGVGAEPAAPDVVGENHDRLFGLQLARIEGATNAGREPDRTEELTRHGQAAQLLRGALVAQVHFFGAVRRDRLESSAMVANELVLQRSQCRNVATPRPDPPDVREIVGTRDRQRPQERRVYHGKERGARSDAERHRENGGSREGRRSSQAAQRKADIRDQVLRNPCAVCLAAGLLERFRAPEGEPGLTPCNLRRHATLHIARRGHLEMELHLLIHLALPGVAIETAAQTRPQRSQRHARAPLKIKLTPCESFSHCARSDARCFLPARVIV